MANSASENVDGFFSFLYFIYMIILTLKFIICVLFFSVIVMIHLDLQECHILDNNMHERG